MKKKEAISVDKMIYVISKSPRDLDELKYQFQKGNVKLFEKLFKIGGGIIEYKTKGINKGKAKYIIPSDFKYNRDILCKKLFGISFDQLNRMKTILEIGIRVDSKDMEEYIMEYKHMPKVIELYKQEHKLCRWYNASTPLLAKKSELNIFAKQPLWQSELDTLIKKCNAYIKTQKDFKLIDCDKYDDMWSEINDKIIALKDAEYQSIILS